MCWKCSAASPRVCCACFRWLSLGDVPGQWLDDLALEKKADRLPGLPLAAEMRVVLSESTENGTTQEVVMKKAVIKAAAALCLVVAVAGAAGYGGARLAGSGAPDPLALSVDPNQQQDLTVSAVGAISIPCFDAMTFRAGQTSQRVRFYNPDTNACSFSVSILLKSGKEIYRSEILRPGDSIDEIELAVPLEAAHYAETILRYTCYTLEGDPRELNGADSLFDLEVIP